MGPHTIPGEEEGRAPVQLFGPPNKNGFSTIWTVRANRVKQVKADTILIGCMDHRFQRCERLLITEHMNIGAFDHIRVPGPDLIFAGGGQSAEACMIRKWIDTSIRLHDPNGIMIIGHWNCGGHPSYHSCADEEQGHEDALVESLDFLSRCYPNLRMTGFYSRLTGNRLDFRKRKLLPFGTSPAAGNGQLVTVS